MFKVKYLSYLSISSKNNPNVKHSKTNTKTVLYIKLLYKYWFKLKIHSHKIPYESLNSNNFVRKDEISVVMETIPIQTREDAKVN